MRTNVKTEYDTQAEDFLSITNSAIECKFNSFAKHFADDKHERFIFDVIIKRGNRSMSFKYGGSLKDVEDYLRKTQRVDKFQITYPPRVLLDEDILKTFKYSIANSRLKHAEKIPTPSAYDILTCLTKYDCGTFEDFCNEFGYDTDSRKAEKTY